MLLMAKSNSRKKSHPDKIPAHFTPDGAILQEKSRGTFIAGVLHDCRWIFQAAKGFRLHSCSHQLFSQVPRNVQTA